MGRGKSSVVWKFFKVVYFGADKRTRYTCEPKKFYFSVCSKFNTQYSSCISSRCHVDVTYVDQIWPITMEQRLCINI